MASKPVNRGPVIEVSHSYDERDTMLYALGLGLGRDPTDPIDLGYVYEKSLRAVPTMPAAMAFVPTKSFGLPFDLSRALHGEQHLTIHSPIPVRGTVTGRAQVTDIIDLGANKGALVLIERRITDAESGVLLAVSESTIFCRADGGFDAAPRPRPVTHAVPARAPDRIVTVAVDSRAGLIYRLFGDHHPLHVDPDVARSAGYDRPILHGLATYGMIGWAILHEFFGGDARAMRAFGGRFSAPVLPDDTLRIELWHDGEEISVRATALGRNVVVFNNGRMLTTTA